MNSAQKNKEYCYWHDPERKEELRSKKRGVRVSHRVSKN